MLIETDKRTFKNLFPTDANPFISEKFIELNSRKADRIVRLVDNSNEHVIGLVAGIIDGALKSPFSAPFGGFHFRKENIYISEIDRFVKLLVGYSSSNGLHRIDIVMPPDIYHMTFNAKVISALLRNGYHFMYPEITGWVQLQDFRGVFTQKNCREYYRQAQRNNLIFNRTENVCDKKEIYELICENRAKFGRPIYMTFDNIMSTGEIWPIDFFKVESPDQQIVASAIFYRNHHQICYALFWGDNDKGRSLRAMDFLLLNLFSYYKEAGFKYIDLGISTEDGIPNEGLLRFKESHEAVSSLRYKCVFEIN